MGELIGYQHGATAAANRLRDIDPAGTKLVKKSGKWPSIDTLPNQDTQENWGAWDKIERAWSMTFYAHDQAASSEPAPTPPPPDGGGTPPATSGLAPQTYNRGAGGQDARYCTRDSGNPDAGGYHYDENGLCRGGRTGNPVPGLKQSDMMDDKGACDSYEWGGRTFPPWPPESYNV